MGLNRISEPWLELNEIALEQQPPLIVVHSLDFFFVVYINGTIPTDNGRTPR
jgi:hypothetical protein